ncbi:hypothetical protein HNR44_001804 [Geomicrobium halophilum]|uniref:Uncharacterized protein n=1 Tax=Geomicrobium halophilum TaxID=549000 RepID=A0A841PRN2_9BACL|nr:hypothetical protein [Geomicrobium halophilum]
MKPPYTKPYVRWCERSAVSHRLLLDIPLKGFFGTVTYFFTDFFGAYDFITPKVKKNFLSNNYELSTREFAWF